MPNWEKRKKWEKIFWGYKTGNKGITSRGFRDYKWEQEGSQIGAALGISNRDLKITNRGRDFKSGKEISSQGSSDFKLGQGLQIGAEQHHSVYYLAHHPDVSSNITYAIHFNTPPTSHTLAHQLPYPRWLITNGLSPIIMINNYN